MRRLDRFGAGADGSAGADADADADAGTSAGAEPFMSRHGSLDGGLEALSVAECCLRLLLAA